MKAGGTVHVPVCHSLPKVVCHRVECVVASNEQFTQVLLKLPFKFTGPLEPGVALELGVGCLEGLLDFPLLGWWWSVVPG